MIKKCVDCINLINNPVIENLSVFNENLYIQSFDEKGEYKITPVAPYGYWPSHLKHVKNMRDLMMRVANNEKLLYALKPEEETKFNSNDILTINFAEKVEEKPKRQIGDKLYLVKYEDFSLNGLGKDANYFILVQVKMNPDETCSIEGIRFTSDSKKELNENLVLQHGGYSGLYYLTNNTEVLEKYGVVYCEATKTTEDSWEFIKLANNKGSK